MTRFASRSFPALGLLGLSTLLISGCLSGSGSSSDDGPLSGQFIDSPVAGLSFRTDSTNGLTDADGNFQYLRGETVHFAIGDLDLGSATGQPVLSPVDLIAEADDSSHPAAINLARLLQSLDADGNLNNGIQLDAALHDAISDYLANNPGFDLSLMDNGDFAVAANALLGYLNDQDLFAAGDRILRDRLNAWLHLQDSLDATDGEEVDFDKRPVVFVHGGAGSAGQFESQAQRFIANGYPRSHLATYEYDTNPPDFTRTTMELNALIDALRQSTGFEQVNLMGHSMGTEVSRIYLADPSRAAKVAAYVNLDGRDGEAPPGGVPNLVLWGQYVDREVVGADNVYPSEEDPVGHIEVATSADSFARMYRFFNDGAEPATTAIPAAEGEHLWIAGRANLFPSNSGAAGSILEISEVDPTTGRSLADLPQHTQAIGSDGHWGPFQINNGGTYEFVLRRPDAANADHYFYREAYTQHSYQIRLNTSEPGEGLGARLARSPNHSNLSISRDMELWGDQGDSNDQLLVNGTNVITAQTGPLLKRLSNIFLHDRNTDGVSNLTAPDPVFHLFPFISGLDLFIPGAAEPDSVIELELISRRGGEPRRVNVPNWSSDKVRSISVHFRDYVE
ncbi:alpha/beta fold hydrolase [Halopseudomonas salegens]|uniref:Alpha/beta hydrolase fold n=1 Tax=Halopseudomonas salegens TaxID=1434072 RepID=A0A1H2H2W9_9GAMM|nr:alpha/beta fold hydrolase [Halopseudomonas salegens]SDU26210.1 alpha/beta hydrolase fold [Halopseudomonas salegens]